MKPFDKTQGKKRVYSGIRTKKTDSMYFDDCLICLSTKKAEDQGRNLGEKELLDVFAKQNRRNEEN